MTETSKGDELMDGIRRRLDADVDALDDATLARLGDARRAALAVAARPAARGRWKPRLAGHGPGDWMLPAGAFASVVATAVALTLMVGDPGAGIAGEIDDLEMLTAGEEIELYENLEFYLWLQDREHTG